MHFKLFEVNMYIINKELDVSDPVSDPDPDRQLWFKISVRQNGSETLYGSDWIRIHTEIKSTVADPDPVFLGLLDPDP
jgi:hypothetical protein